LISRVEELIESRRAKSRTVRPGGIKTDRIAALGSREAVRYAGGATGAGCVTTGGRTSLSMMLSCGDRRRPQGGTGKALNCSQCQIEFLLLSKRRPFRGQPPVLHVNPAAEQAAVGIGYLGCNTGTARVEPRLSTTARLARVAPHP
jgi:hypothetical protein